MTKVTTTGGKLAIVFVYPRHIMKMNNIWGRPTICRIFSVLDEIDPAKNLPKLKLCGEGLAVCSPKDQFTRRVGRKIALQRAVQHFSDALKKEIWEGFFKTCRQ